METATFLKQMLGIAPGSIVDTTIDTSLLTATAISKIYNSYQMMRLKNRLNTNEEKLQQLKDQIDSSNNEVFYKQEVFPIILNQLLNEDQDEKAKIIIEGFEHIIDNKIDDIERIYHYYDVLAELRYSDILLFIKKYMPYDMKDPDNLKLDLDLLSMEDLRTDEYKEKEAIKSYQKNKMVRLGLLENRVKDIDKDNPSDKSLPLIEEVTVITDFGRRFLIWFA